MPDAPAAAAPVASAPTPSAAAPAPSAVQPAPTAPATEKSQPGAVQSKPTLARKRLGEGVKSYASRPVHTEITGSKVAYPPPTPAPATTPEAPLAPNASQAPPPVGGMPAPEAPKPADPPPPAPDAPKPADKPALTEAEESARIARIQRAEKQLNDKQQAFRVEQQTYADAMRKVQLIDQAGQHVQKDLLGFLRQAFGIQPQQVIDALLSDSAKPPEVKAQEQAASEQAAHNRRLAELEKQVQASVEAQRQQAHAGEVAAYKTSTVAPAIADQAKYELTHRVLGDSAVDEVFALQQARYQLTAREVAEGKRAAPEMLTPGEAADIIEAHFRSQRDRLTGGPSVAPATSSAPTTTRTEPPAAQASGSQTQKPATAGGTYRAPKPAITAKNPRYMR